jgi:hypothetical protein
MISVTYEGRILLVITDNPPVNALTAVDAAQSGIAMNFL